VAEEQDVSVPGVAPDDEPPPVDDDEFEKAFGESLAEALDVDTWELGQNLLELYARMEREVEEAVQQEGELRERIREVVFPRLSRRPGAPKDAGVRQAHVEDVAKVHRGLLFNGAVESCDGTCVVNDRLPLTIVQIGVCLVSYRGDQGSWVHRLFRRDLRVRGADPVDEALELLERRRQRSGYDLSSRRDTLSELARRGLMTYAERAVLLHRSNAPWRMGHGNPAPYELLTGSGMVELLKRSLELLDELVLDHQRFVFVPSAPASRMYFTIGNALRPLEYAIVDTAEPGIRRLLRGHYRGEWAPVAGTVERFAAGAGSKIVVGVYRASAMAPPQVFYAHADHAHEAALIAIADSVLQEHRGFPMLIDLADTVCGSTFGADSFGALTELAYVEAGAPYQYSPERQTRNT
jgi:hypothetical protein